MSPTLIALVGTTIVLDVFGQLAFKLGLDQVETEESASLRFWSRLLTRPWLLAGVLAYGVEFFLWLAVLSGMELSLAFPLASLSYCGVQLASRLVLREAVSPRRWAGCALITVGAALVCAGASA